MVAVGAAGASQRRTVLDDKVDDPLAGLDETPHEWTDEHGDGYDPEKQNVWADEDAFPLSCNQDAGPHSEPRIVVDRGRR